MKQMVVSVLGQDRPGIVAAVSNILYDLGCNIEDLTQTILQAEFAAMLLVDCPSSSLDMLETQLNQALNPLNLSAFLRPAAKAAAKAPEPCTPLVITTSGPDCSGQVARVSEVINRFGGNITELKAVSHQDTDDARFIMIFEIDMPLTGDQSLLRKELATVCNELHLEYSVQHRDIFESINRI